LLLDQEKECSMSLSSVCGISSTYRLCYLCILFVL